MVAYYVGALFLYEFWTVGYTGDITLGFEIVRFDPHVAAVALSVVLAGRGLTVLRTHPATRDRILSGAFTRTEVISIEYLAITGVTALYADIETGGFLEVTGVMLYSTLLGGALSANVEIAIVFYIFKWAYTISNSREGARSTD